jgi:hypothetical protein
MVVSLVILAYGSVVGGSCTVEPTLPKSSGLMPSVSQGDPGLKRYILCFSHDQHDVGLRLRMGAGAAEGEGANEQPCFERLEHRHILIHHCFLGVCL